MVEPDGKWPDWAKASLPREAGPDPEIGEHLRGWLDELARYDADPDAWNRAYFRRLLRSFAEKHGMERAGAFGVKMVAGGQLILADVDEALGT